MEKISIYYDYNTNLFSDEFGSVEDSVVGIMSYDEMLRYKSEGGLYRREIGGVIYEIDFPTNNNVEQILYYNIACNIMVDDEGREMFNIFSIISPNQLLLFKKNKVDITTRTISGGFVTLMYGDEDDEED